MPTRSPSPTPPPVVALAKHGLEFFVRFDEPAGLILAYGYPAHAAEPNTHQLYGTTNMADSEAPIAPALS